jgi:hypothetical protein
VNPTLTLPNGGLAILTTPAGSSWTGLYLNGTQIVAAPVTYFPAAGITGNQILLVGGVNVPVGTGTLSGNFNDSNGDDQSVTLVLVVTP